MVGNPMGGMNQLGSKSPNMQSPTGMQQGNMGMVNSMPMSISNNGTQAGMNSIPGKRKII